MAAAETSSSKSRFGIKVALFGAIAFSSGIALGGFNRQQQSLATTTIVSSSTVRGAKKKKPLLLPDWHMTTHCSAYSRDCVLRQLNQHDYAPYPFLLAKQYEDRYEWRDKLPEGWNQSLKEHHFISEKQSPKKSLAIKECVLKAQQQSVEEQLDQLLDKKLTRVDDMLSFTISDYLYTRDMMQDVFEMAHNVVGFKDAFFMVAMDVPTMELACQYDYPFLAWPQETKEKEALKQNVANTKFDISYALTKRRQSFFFFEMDVWWVKSPIPVLREQTEDILFSGHQNNPEAANIGVYSVLANEASEEYMRICVEIMSQSPDTHDQVIMQQVYIFLNQLKAGQPLKYVGALEEQDPPLKLPTFKHPATHGRFVPYQIAADERPVTSEDTLAIHTLCGAPLRNPHGKKMVAKELGAWYGSGDYYAGKDNRYLWVDGHVWNGFSIAMSWPGYHPWASYHSISQLHWIVAATVALARRTGRIWVMPKILNDAGVHFIWTILDMESVEALVDVRETNFPVNPKAWHNPSMPFEPVARTALGDQGKIFAQLDAADTSNNTDNILAWKPETYAATGESSTSPFDAWFAIHTSIPELDNAQVLLAGLPVGKSLIERLQAKARGTKQKLTMAEAEIVDVWKKLRWCQRGMELEMIAGRAAADWDCYLQGQPLEDE